MALRRDLTSTDHRKIKLSCPRCGLRVTPTSRWSAIEFCPRCLAQARTRVGLFPDAPQCDTRAIADLHAPGE